jgi:arylsulfate sulfotransferase
MPLHDEVRCISMYPRGKTPEKPIAGSRVMSRLCTVLICGALSASLASAENQAVAGKPGIMSPPPVQTTTATTGADFTLSASPTGVKLAAGGAAEDFEVVTVAKNGLKGTITVTFGTLPEGVTATPASLKLTAGAKATVELKASRAAEAGSFSVPVKAVDGTLTHESALTVAVTSTPTDATLNNLEFDFGDNLVGNPLVQTAVVITNTGTTTLTLAPKITGNASFSIVKSKSCGTTLLAGKACDMVLDYNPTVASYPKAQTATLDLDLGNVDAGVPQTVALSGTSGALKPGTVTATDNPGVALYTMVLPFPGQIKVDFTPTTGSNIKTLDTWWQSTDENNGTVSVLVAGMKPATTYNLQAQIILNANEIVAKDVTHSFTTGAGPVTPYSVVLTATTSPGMTPQPGIEMTNPLNSLQAFDLSGNLVWWYPVPTPELDYLDGAKMLPDGNILVTIGMLSNAPLTSPPTTSTVNELREIDFTGASVKEISITDLNAELQTATCTECQDSPDKPLVLQTFHHDVTPLPNGHWIALSNEIRTLDSSTTPALNTNTPTKVIGDVIVDLDENLQPVWVWNEFNHLNVNRQPYSFPDWTHTNAIVYSQDDGNLIVSIRHQNWVLKVDYDNGRGDGAILWTLGDGGDLKLSGAASPQGWQYAQHGPAFFTPNTSGVFSLGVFDNGDDRLYPAGSKCTPQGKLPTSCLYSTVPIFRIDETAKTATVIFHQILPADEYSNFGGNVDSLANGHVEYDICGIGTSSIVREVTDEAEPKTVWQMSTNKTNLYRAWRIPSLYPDVQW